MSYLGAKLFAWLQGAEFYINLHRKAVEQMPEGKGKTWIDFGCGPGLLTRIAASKGYDAKGIDADPFMIREAKKIAQNSNSSATFEIGNLFHVSPQSADVVSASSLLAALEDKIGGFQALLRTVRPGGSLLIIEPTDHMMPQTADTLIQSGVRGRRISGLRLWAHARQGRAVDPEIFNTSEAEQVRFIPLLGGLVGAWLIQTKTS